MLGAGGSGISQFLCWHILPKDLEPPSPSKCCLWCLWQLGTASVSHSFQAHLGEGSEHAELWVQPGPQCVLLASWLQIRYSL